MKYNHAFTIAFTVETDNEADEVTSVQLINGLAARLKEMIDNGDEIIEAFAVCPLKLSRMTDNLAVQGSGSPDQRKIHVN